MQYTLNCLFKGEKMIEKSKFVLVFLTIILIAFCFFFESTLLYWCTAAFLFLVCIALGKREKRILNPYYLFSITPFTLLIYKNISNVYMMDLEPSTWRIAIINIAIIVSSKRSATVGSIPQSIRILFIHFPKSSTSITSVLFY